MNHTTHRALAEKLGGLFAGLAEVEAVALAGSQATGADDSGSDIDVYVYTRGEIPLSTRMAIIDQSGGASRANLGLASWGPGDEWFDAVTGIEADVMFFDCDWMEAQIRRVVQAHQPSLGYSTCFWHTLRLSIPLFDRQGWFANIQALGGCEYPEALRRNIIAYNHPVLRGVIPAYLTQIEKAVRRGDAVSINHRLAALLASYFDIIFAVNRVPHPGEKRLVELARQCCQRLPMEMAADLDAVLASASGGDGLLVHLDRLLDRLDDFLAAEAVLESGRAGSG